MTILSADSSSTDKSMLDSFGNKLQQSFEGSQLEADVFIEDSNAFKLFTVLFFFHCSIFRRGGRLWFE